jgi:glutathione S-transferase
VHQWLAFGDALTGTISAARLHDAMFFVLDVEKARAGAVKLLRVLDDHLWFAETNNQMWLCSGGHPTIADIACFPYVALAEEAGVDMAPFGAIQRWIERFMRIDGFEPMAGMMPLTMPKEASN